MTQPKALVQQGTSWGANPRQERVLFRSAGFAIGTFCCRPPDLSWLRADHAENYLAVFPWSPCIITQAGDEPVIADPSVVMFYNRGQPYSAKQVVNQGESCAFFALDPRVLVQALRAHDPAVEDRPDQPWSFSHGPSDAASFLTHRLIVQHAMGGSPDALWMEETLYSLLSRIVTRAYEARGLRMRDTPQSRSGSDYAAAARLYLCQHFRERLNIDHIADAVELSPFYLCRLFRARTGTTLHEFREQLRIRAALQPLCDGVDDLTTLGLELGYCSHSHFTNAFRRRFGMPPAAFRRLARECTGDALRGVVRRALTSAA